jgi:D-alanine-D-alanine ligase
MNDVGGLVVRTPERRQIAVLAGGLTHERDISLKSGARLSNALEEMGHDVSILDPDASLLSWLLRNKPDVAISALHGGRGENGDVQTILEMTETPYIGTRSHDCRMAFDKTIAKSSLAAGGYKTPEWVTLGQSTFRDLGANGIVEHVIEKFGLPLIVKPNMGGSALGVNLIRKPEQLSGGLVGAFAYCDTVIVEHFVRGVELAIATIDIGNESRALPAVQIVPAGDFYDYESRYTAGQATYYAPAELDDQILADASQLAVAAHNLLRMRQISRTDIIVDHSGVPWFLESTMSPGLTETSILNLSLAVAGTSLGSVYSDLIELAISRRL